MPTASSERLFPRVARMSESLTPVPRRSKPRVRLWAAHGAELHFCRLLSRGRRGRTRSRMPNGANQALDASVISFPTPPDAMSGRTAILAERLNGLHSALVLMCGS